MTPMELSPYFKEMIVAADFRNITTLEEYRRNEMMRLRFEERRSLQYIGDLFGISRERVRKIIGNTGDQIHYSKSMDTLKVAEWLEQTANKTNQEIADELGISASRVSSYRSKMRHALDTSNRAITTGSKWEEWASEQLAANGIENQLMPHHHPFDILALDRIRIDVKSTETPRFPPSQKNISPMYAFGVKGEKKRSDTDFYLCVIAIDGDEPRAFVIPAQKVPSKMNHITFCYPTLRPELSKWQNYLNRYDLILEAAKSD